MKDEKIFLSICIPNFNYGSFIGRTIKSIIDQKGTNFEILVSDNKSTDNSIEVIKSFKDKRIKLSQNKLNIGFAPNLNKACHQSEGKRMILLSSDDIVLPQAFEIYKRLDELLKEDSEKTIFCSALNVVNENDQKLEKLRFLERVWKDSKVDENLSQIINSKVYRISSKVLLSNSLHYLCNPLSFCTTCYPRNIFENVEGYPYTYSINPDKAFNFKLLAFSEYVLYVDKPLFGYRFHSKNIKKIDTNITSLKLLIDQYRYTIDLDKYILDKASHNKTKLITSFVKYDIALKSMELLAKNQRKMAIRYLNFGKSVYPLEISKSFLIKFLILLINLGPLGILISSKCYQYVLLRFKKGNFFKK